MNSAKLKKFYCLSIAKRFRKIQEQARKDVLALGRVLTENPNLNDITTNVELEQLCDCLTLIRTRAIELEYSDCLPDKENEGILIRLNVE